MGIENSAVLIVDDHEQDRNTLVRQLAQEGYDVLATADATQAMSLIRGKEIGLVLLSANLPDNAGRQLLTTIQQDEDLSTVPVLALVPATDLESAELWLDLGASDYAVYPSTAALLNVRVRAALRQRQLAGDDAAEERMDKIEHDIQVARRIQAGFLPTVLPDPPGWEITAGFQPAREVAGDWYDAFMLSQNRRVGFVIADVVDKGVPAALFMALVRSLTRAFAQQHYSLSWTEALDDKPARSSRRPARARALPTTGTTSLRNAVLLTNNYIIDNHAQDNMFATLFFGMLDPSNGQLAYINGGHNPPFIVGADGSLKATLKGTGPAVGMFPGVDFGIEFAQFDPGDVLFAYTDGVTEARNPAGEFFSEKRLISLISRPVSSASEMLNLVDTTLRDFISTATQFDDITMMSIRRAQD